MTPGTPVRVRMKLALEPIRPGRWGDRDGDPGAAAVVAFQVEGCVSRHGAHCPGRTTLENFMKLAAGKFLSGRPRCRAASRVAVRESEIYPTRSIEIVVPANR